MELNMSAEKGDHQRVVVVAVDESSHSRHAFDCEYVQRLTNFMDTTLHTTLLCRPYLCKSMPHSIIMVLSAPNERPGTDI